MNKMKKNFIIMLMNIAFLSIALITSVFAWYLGAGSSSESLRLQSAKVESTITLYEGQDFNHDGNLDLDFKDSSEIYNKVVEENALSHNLIFKFDTVAPSLVYTWKIDVVNNGDVDGYLIMNINDNIGSNRNLFKIAKITLLDESNISLGSKNFRATDLESFRAYNNILFGAPSEYSNVDSGKSKYLVKHTKDQNKKSYIIQVEFELISNITGVTNEDYQALQGEASGSDFDFISITLTSNRPVVE